MIIKSFVDNDLYKFTMQNSVFTKYPKLFVEYELIIRNNVKFPDGFATKLSQEIAMMKELKLTENERSFMENKCGRFLPPTYFDFLSAYRYDPSEVTVYQDSEGNLKLKIRGYWYRTILWEVPIMAIISELYFKMTLGDNYPSIEKLNKLNEIDNKKATTLKLSNCFFSDFGTRRRFSFENQLRVVKNLANYGGKNFTGTSNVYIAHLLDLNCTGTMAHEYISAHAALFGYRMANRMAMNSWVDTYDGDLGIALTDTFTTDVFLKSFGLKEAKLFDGVRHDSGDPFEYVDKIVAHYNKLKIDPMTKVIVFSDGLNVDLAVKLKDYCAGKIKQAFGIGTHFTNDLLSLGITPMNMVIKLTRVLVDDEWVGAVKLSDNVGKHTGKPEDIKLSKETLNIPTITYDRIPAGNENDNK